MAKARSPQYPAIGLLEAIQKVSAVYAKDYQNPLPRIVAAQHMGYGGLNGKALGVLSALGKFGLLDGRGDNTRVTDLAVRIIAHASGTPERAEAIKEAAVSPDLFAELDGKFQGGKVSDQALRAYLLTQKFIPGAADAVIRSYRETKELVEAESAGYKSVEIEPEPETEPSKDQRIFLHAAPNQPRQGWAAALSQFHRAQSAPPEPNDPYRVSVTKSGGIEVVARLRTLKDADELVEAINTWKVLLRKVDDAKRPAAQFRAGEPIPVSGNYWAQHPNGHLPDSGVNLEGGKLFPSCAVCGTEVEYRQVQINERYE